MAKPPPVCGVWKWICDCANCGARGCQWSCRTRMTHWPDYTPCCPEVAYGGEQDRMVVLVGAADAALVIVSTALLPGPRDHRPDHSDRRAGPVRLGIRDATAGGVERRPRAAQSNLDAAGYGSPPERVVRAHGRGHS